MRVPADNPPGADPASSPTHRLAGLDHTGNDVTAGGVEEPDTPMGILSTPGPRGPRAAGNHISAELSSRPGALVCFLHLPQGIQPLLSSLPTRWMSALCQQVPPGCLPHPNSTACPESRALGTGSFHTVLGGQSWG